jgi:FkbM family methyltransferase
MKRTIDRIIRNILGRFGFEVRRKAKTIYDRHTLRGTLEHAKQLGFTPGTVIDVGAAKGTFELYETFPHAKHLLIEPLVENRPYLEKIVKGLKSAEYVIAAAAKEAGAVTLNVHPDFDGSSIYLEDEAGDVNGIPRTVQAVTLDALYHEYGLHGPCLIKLDVQGAELDVLAGATLLLNATEYIVLEVSLFKFFIDGPQFYDVMVFMKERGFVLYDVLGYSYRLLDGAMSQVDLVFVKDNGMFRTHHFYATKEQREAQNKSFHKGTLPA